jgi:hypothetical protein
MKVRVLLALIGLGFFAAMLALASAGKPATHRPSILGIAHIGLKHMIHVGVTVRDRAAADRFYKDILGFRATWYSGMTDDRVDWVDMRVEGGAHDHIVAFALSITLPVLHLCNLPNLLQ